MSSFIVIFVKMTSLPLTLLSFSRMLKLYIALETRLAFLWTSIKHSTNRNIMLVIVPLFSMLVTLSGCRPQRHDKLSPKWSGPFRIYGRPSENAYLLHTHEGDALPSPVSAQHLKLARFNTSIIDRSPLDSAASTSSSPLRLELPMLPLRHLPIPHSVRPRRTT